MRLRLVLSINRKSHIVDLLQISSPLEGPSYTAFLYALQQDLSWAQKIDPVKWAKSHFAKISTSWAKLIQGYILTANILNTHVCPTKQEEQEYVMPSFQAKTELLLLPSSKQALSVIISLAGSLPACWATAAVTAPSPRDQVAATGPPAVPAQPDYDTPIWPACCSQASYSADVQVYLQQRATAEKVYAQYYKIFIFFPTMTPYRHKTQPMSCKHTACMHPHAKFRRRTSRLFRGDSKQMLRRLSVIIWIGTLSSDTSLMLFLRSFQLFQLILSTEGRCTKSDTVLNI